MATTPKPPWFSEDCKRQNSFVADASLASYPYRMVKKTSTGVNLCGSGEDHFGILDNLPASGEYAEVVTQGLEVTGIAAAAVAIGDRLKCAANGKLTPASAGDEACGIALTAAAGDGSYFIFQLSRLVAQ